MNLALAYALPADGIDDPLSGIDGLTEVFFGSWLAMAASGPSGEAGCPVARLDG